MVGTKTIVFGGVEFTALRYPKLYEFAKLNPKGLEAQLRSLNKASGGDGTDLTPDAINLEMDLQHG